MSQNQSGGWLRSSRVLIIGVLAVLIVPGLALIFAAINATTNPAAQEEERRVSLLVNTDNQCVSCHQQTTPGIVQQYSHSTMAAANVTCEDCHEVDEEFPTAIEHEGTFVVNQPTTAMCEGCHQQETATFYQSRHSLPAYVAMVGVDALTAEQREMYERIPEAELGPNQERNALFDIEGPELTRFACESCHNIGRPRVDGSVGECQQCHLRHEFSLEQARKPETCNYCHIGPDHPQFEIYQESPHGIAYATSGDEWNWEAEAGTLTVMDFPAPTCATCHFSGFGASGTTHDVGDRLTWYLFAPISERRPNWQENMVNMQNVCRECHSNTFIEDFYSDADAATERVNELVEQGNEIVAPLDEHGLRTAEFFDEPVDFIQFELWHHWGRTAKFGVWMQGPDYTQWHGVYEMLVELSELEEIVHERLEAAGISEASAEGNP